jgi:hypothetical protein
MHEFWTTPTIDMTYNRMQNYTIMVFGKHEIQALKVVVIVLLLLWLSFDIFVTTNAHPLLVLDM